MQASPNKEFTLPATFTPDKQQAMFEDIVRVYDIADNIMSVVAREGNKKRALHLELARPFITQMVNSANIISAFYTEVVRNGRPVTPELQDTVETAFRNVFLAFGEFLDTAEEKLLPKEG